MWLQCNATHRSLYERFRESKRLLTIFVTCMCISEYTHAYHKYSIRSRAVIICHGRASNFKSSPFEPCGKVCDICACRRLRSRMIIFDSRHNWEPLLLHCKCNLFVDNLRLLVHVHLHIVNNRYRGLSVLPCRRRNDQCCIRQTMTCYYLSAAYVCTLDTHGPKTIRTTVVMFRNVSRCIRFICICFVI